MLISGEIRWFWRDLPADLHTWFREGRGTLEAAQADAPRVDEYLVDGQAELGIKRRGGMPEVEVKGLIDGAFAHLEAPPFSGPIELWCKWRSEAIAMPRDRTLAVQKSRWMRRFATADGPPSEITAEERAVSFESGVHRGCNVELTRVDCGGQGTWWTFGFESFGPLASLEQDLRAVAQVLARRSPPTLAAELRCSYAAWLAEHLSINPTHGKPGPWRT